MSIFEKHVYQATSLPGAPERATLAEAEADEARGVELQAYLALLATLADKQWKDAAAARYAVRNARAAAWDAAWYAARYAVRNARAAARDAAWDAVRDVARYAAWYAVRDVARYAAWDAARYAAWDAARDAAADAAFALVVRDLITAEQFDTLTAPMRAAGIDFDRLGVAGE